MNTFNINEVDHIEVVPLQYNYIDMWFQDNNHAVKRAMPMNNNGMPLSILAIHGFSALIATTKGKQSRRLLFDFGFSDHGAAANADIVDLNCRR